MEMASYIKAILALVFVVGLIGVVSLLLKKYLAGGLGILTAKSKPRRLSVEEIYPLDARRRIILIKRDNTEHLILLGATSETLIETDIKRENT